MRVSNLKHLWTNAILSIKMSKVTRVSQTIIPATTSSSVKQGLLAGRPSKGRLVAWAWGFFTRSDCWHFCARSLVCLSASLFPALYLFDLSLRRSIMTVAVCGTRQHCTWKFPFIHCRCRPASVMRRKWLLLLVSRPGRLYGTMALWRESVHRHNLPAKWRRRYGNICFLRRWPVALRGKSPSISTLGEFELVPWSRPTLSKDDVHGHAIVKSVLMNGDRSQVRQVCVIIPRPHLHTHSHAHPHTDTLIQSPSHSLTHRHTHTHTLSRYLPHRGLSCSSAGHIVSTEPHRYRLGCELVCLGCELVNLGCE